MTSPSPLAPCPSPFNLAAHVLARAGDQPDKPALCILGRTDECWSFGEIAAAVRGTATGLARLGLGPGARILMRIGNRPDFPILYLGAIAAGMVPVPTSSQLTAPEITLMARLLSPDLIVAEDGLALPDPAPCDVLTLAQLRAFHRLPPAPYDLGPPDRAAYIVFTSGTSREPRAVVHGHRAIWARRSMLAGWTGLTGADRILHAGAFNWTYTLGVGLMDPWSVGATALIPAPGTRPADLPALLARSEATLFAAAPGVFRQVLRAPMPRLPRLRHGLSAGESLPEDLRGNWQAATGTPVHQAFGMSECSTFISGSSARPAPAGTLGFAQPGREVAILGADGAPLPAGEAGVIAIRGDDPGLMLGYLGAGPPPLTRGWFLTGDLGAQGPDGAIRYLGRADDVMTAGGYRVSPLEVEAALERHPLISEAAACEVTLASGARVIAAFYVAPDVIDPESLDEAELAGFAAASLARYKCPRIFVRLAGLPRGPNDKLLRRALRLRWEGENGQA